MASVKPRIHDFKYQTSFCIVVGACTGSRDERLLHCGDVGVKFPDVFPLVSERADEEYGRSCHICLGDLLVLDIFSPLGVCI